MKQAAGEAPVYIGFGSIVVDDPDKFTAVIFKAVEKAGVRALVSKGWGGLGDEGNIPDNIYMLENTPHDWLFPRVSAVIHHGGAGTTAIGLKCGKPTMIVPFFGDQPFWGAMVGKAGAGADGPVPYKHLTSDALAEGIRQCLMPQAKHAAEGLAKAIADEGDGAKNAVESFQRHLATMGERSMRCSILPDRVAVWMLKDSNLRLSALAATLLVGEQKIRWQELRLLRHCEWTDFAGPGEPLTGTGAALLSAIGGAAKGVGGVPFKWARTVKKREQKRKRSQNSTPRNGSDAKNAKQSKPKGHLETTIQDPRSSDAETNTIEDVGSSGPLSPDHKKPLPHPTSSPPSSDNLIRDLADDTTAGLAQTGEAIAKAPLDLSLALAQGFHNAPRLYGDDTVRTAPRIEGFRSGCRAAGRAFGLGVYDGVTGLVSQPAKGAREGYRTPLSITTNGANGVVKTKTHAARQEGEWKGSVTGGIKGATKGTAKGIGGFVLKDLGAIFAPPAYVLKGLHKEVGKRRRPINFVRRARVLQGELELGKCRAVEVEDARDKVRQAWKIVEETRREEAIDVARRKEKRKSVIMGRNGKARGKGQ